MKKTVFVVEIDWVNESGDSDCTTFVFDSIEKAEEQLRKEVLGELDSRKGDTLYYEKDESAPMLEELLKQFKESDFDFAETDDDDCYVIEISPTYFSCYRQGYYSSDHINVRIKERNVE